MAAIARKEFQEIFDPEWTQERSDFHARKEKEKTKKAAKKKGNNLFNIDRSKLTIFSRKKIRNFRRILKPIYKINLYGP